MRSFAAFALAVILTPAALAQHQTFVVNPDACEVKMTLKTTHELVNGTFHVQSGSIEFDRSTPKMSGSVVVLAGSGKTGNDSRDKKMNKDILKVEQYATVSFEPKTYTGAIAPSGDSTIQITGIFTLLGTPHEITVPVLVHLDGTSTTAKAHFVVPYVQWGLKNPSFLFWKADNDVAIDLNLAGTISKVAFAVLLRSSQTPLSVFPQPAKPRPFKIEDFSSTPAHPVRWAEGCGYAILEGYVVV